MLYSDVGADSANCVTTKIKKTLRSAEAEVVFDVMQASEGEIQTGFRSLD